MTNVAIILFAITLPWSEPTPQHVPFERGVSTYYAPKLMDKVVANRGMNVPEGFIPVALNRKGDIGRIVWVYFPRSGNLYPAISVDCAASDHYGDRLELNRVVEVPAWVAQDEGFYGVGPEPVEVWYTVPLHYILFGHRPI